ncbi:MAG TPA: histone deacetylase family protein, partial [Burkholderiales bacterium]|nr:histone deacetylase family protein [Burkholderiales bacterium]
MTLAYITHADCLLHEMGARHPECPQRLRAIEDQLIASGLMNYLRHLDAPLAQRAQLERVHSPAYVSALERAAPE